MSDELTTVEISQRILDALKENPTLDDYVKAYSIGGMDVSRKIFPYVAVEAPERDSEALTMGRGGYMNNHYTFRIFGGTRHTIPEVAHCGNNNGGKGIIQLHDDLLNAVIPCDFGGVFAAPVRLVQSTTAGKTGSGGRVWMTMIILSGRIKTNK